jgi:hypothetical protein
VDDPVPEWAEALQNTLKHGGNPIYDTVSATIELLGVEKSSE